MTQESKDYLKSKLPMWELFKSVGIIPHLPTDESQRLLKIAREIDERYTGTIWCQSCLEDVVKFVFVNYEKILLEEMYTPSKSETIVIKQNIHIEKGHRKSTK